MKQKSRTRVFWEMVLEDKDLVFFSLGFLAWLVNFTADLVGVKNNTWPWFIVSICIPIFFGGGLTFYLRKHYLLSIQLTSLKHLPVVFVVGKPREEARKALTSAQESITRLTGFKAFKQLEEAFNVQYEHLMPHRREWLGHESIQWKDFIEDAERDVHRFSDSIPGEKAYHIFVYGPASLALGLGTAFGTKRQLVVYQSVDGQYKPVINLMKDVRRIKQVVSEPEYKYVQVSYPTQFTRDLGVILEMASHVPRGDVYTYLKAQSIPIEVAEISNTYGGNLTEDDWAGVVQEMYSVFRILKSRAEVTRLHLFHTLPVALAFGLGAALGNFVPVTVYNWEPSETTYYPVLQLNELESFI